MYSKKSLYKLSKIANAFLLSLLLCSLSGCAIFKKSGPTADIDISAVEYLNPNINGQASPIVVTVYQLKSPYNFKQANYHELVSNSAKALSNDLIDKTTLEVRPSENKTISVPLSPNTNYIGIMAAYRDIENSNWHTTLEVKNEKNKRTKIYLVLESRALSAKKVDGSTNILGIF